jgi:hypothetical protein
MIDKLETTRRELHTSNTAWTSYDTESATGLSERCRSLHGMIDAALLETELAFQKHIKRCTKRHAACAHVLSASALWVVAWSWCGKACRSAHLETLFRPTMPGQWYRRYVGGHYLGLREWEAELMVRVFTRCSAIGCVPGKADGLSRCGW